MTGISEVFDRLLQDHQIEVHYELGRFAIGESSDVFLGFVDGRSCIVKISKSRQAAGELSPRLERKRKILLHSQACYAPRSSFAGPIKIVANHFGHLVSCWEQAEGTIADRWANSTTPMKWAKADALREISHIAEAMKRLRIEGVEDGIVAAANLLVFGAKLKVGDVSLPWDEREVLQPFVPHNSDWRYRHRARDVYSLLVTYIMMRIGQLPFAHTHGDLQTQKREGEPVLTGLDPDEVRTAKRVLSFSSTRCLELDNLDWCISSLKGETFRPAKSPRDYSKQGAHAKDALSCHWFDKQRTIRFVRSEPEANTLLVWISISQDPSHIKLGEFPSGALESEFNLPDFVGDNFAVFLTDVTARLVATRRFRRGPSVQAQAKGLRVEWHPGTWDAVRLQARLEKATWEIDQFLKAPVRSGDFAKTGRLEREPMECFVTPVDVDGTYGSTETVLVGPAIQSVQVLFEHVEEGEHGHFLIVNLDASTCELPPRAEVMWQRFLPLRDRDSTFIVEWKDRKASLPFYQIEIKDRLIVRFLDGNVQENSSARRGEEHRELSEPCYTFLHNRV